MTKKAPALKAGDACPSCRRGTLEAAIVPTAEELAKAFERENPTGLPDGYDTANAAQREQLGPLSTCSRCGYAHRETPADTAAAA
ncbi:MAG TPA: hypothetical protein VJN96_09145 [Vicinamibacterales bacterium]|nr:hypothetical protein [Vicinamibacterales bacterium]